MPNETSMVFRYHYAGINEDETLKLFADQYPLVYSSYKDKIMRIPSFSPSTNVTLLPSDYYLDNDLALSF
jgi:hypothetical protein